MHAIIQLQAALVAALEADAALRGLIGAKGIFDAPPRHRSPPYVVVSRHEMRQRDGDLTPGQEHIVLLQCWADQPSRKAALALAEFVVAAKDRLTPAGLAVTLAEHVRTQTQIEPASGLARAAVTLRFLSE